MNPTTTKTSKTDSVKPISVNRLRNGRRNKLRTPYSHGSNRTPSIFASVQARSIKTHRVDGGISKRNGRSRCSENNWLSALVLAARLAQWCVSRQQVGGEVQSLNREALKDGDEIGWRWLLVKSPLRECSVGDDRVTAVDTWNCRDDGVRFGRVHYLNTREHLIV
jgi:hypothetical protein